MNKVIGSILVGAGTAIGAGTLALPIVVAGMGFSWAAIILIAIWALSWITSLMLLETNLAFKAPNNSYAAMAQTTLGRTGKWVTAVMFMLLLYALTSAYISGGASLIQAGSKLLFDYSLPNWINATLFAVFLGSIIALSTRAVDLFNRGLFGIKTVLLAIVFVTFMPQIDLTQLMINNHLAYTAVGIPVIFASFGSAIIIPSIAPYMNNDVKKLKTILLYSSLLPLIVYLVWIACMLGTIPYYGENSLATIARSSTQIETLIFVITESVRAPWMAVVINILSYVLLITSFLGVGLSLFDFLRDTKAKVTPSRFRTALLTFVPALVVGLFYRDALIQLLSLAAIFAAFIVVIIPAVMTWRIRHMPHLHSPYRAPGGTGSIIFVIVIAIGIIITEVLRILNFLPVWTG